MDVLVVGGGAAGMAAAKAAAAAGARTWLLEREQRLGGVLDQCIHPGFGLHRYKLELTGPEFAHRLCAELYESGAEVCCDCMVLRITAREALAVSPRGLLRLQFKSLVWAAGAWERPFGPLLIPGSRPAGIFPAGVVQKLINIYGVLPGRRALILGSGDIGLIMARRLALEGLEVVGVAEIKPFPGGLLRNVRQCLEDFGIPLLLRHTVKEVHGSSRLSRVVLVEVDERGQPIPGTEKSFAVDLLVLSVGLIPEVRLLEGIVPLDPVNRGPVVGAFYQTAAPWLFVAGNSLAVFDLVDTVAAVGEAAGEAAAAHARGELPMTWGARLLRGTHVTTLVPHFLPASGRAQLYLRSDQPWEEAAIVLGGIVRKNVQGLRPAEMVEVRLSPEEVQALNAFPEVRVEVVPA